MITVTKMSLGIGAIAAAGLLAVTQAPGPDLRDVAVVKSDRLDIGEAWSPDCEIKLSADGKCVFQSTYGEPGSASRFVTIERRDEPNTSTLVRIPVTDTAMR